MINLYKNGPVSESLVCPKSSEFIAMVLPTIREWNHSKWLHFLGFWMVRTKQKLNVGKPRLLKLMWHFANA